MRIDLASIDLTQFNLKEGVFCGQPAILVTPAVQGTQWTQANKHLRSSIWSLDGELLSGGFPKFTNAGENPEHFPMPASLDHALCLEKVDGSCLIADYVNDQFSNRTRGTFNSETLDNAVDFTVALAKYPGVRQLAKWVPEVSWLYEITTPNQKIVIDYGPEVELTLIGAVHKSDYRLRDQDVLDSLALMHKLRRPRYFTFASLDSCLADVAKWEGLEGCVIYSGPYRNTLHKIKADAYLRAHRFKERVTLPNLLDLFFAYGRPDLLAFLARIEGEFDYECSSSARPIVTQIDTAYTAVTSRYNLMEVAISPLRSLPRRDAALSIQANYTDVWRGAAFHLLDQRPLDDKTVRKLMEAELGL